MLEGTARVFAELLGAKDHLIERSDDLWKSAMEVGVLEELRQLALSLSADVVQVGGRLYLVPVDETCPLLTSHADVTSYLQNKKAAGTPEHRWLLNYIALRFVTHFFDPKSVDGSTGAAFVTVNGLISLIDEDCKVTDTDRGEFSEQFQALDRLALARAPQQRC